MGDETQRKRKKNGQNKLGERQEKEKERQRANKLFEKSNSVVVTWVVMGKGLKYSFLRVIDSPVMDLILFFYKRVKLETQS